MKDKLRLWLADKVEQLLIALREPDFAPHSVIIVYVPKIRFLSRK